MRKKKAEKEKEMGERRRITGGELTNRQHSTPSNTLTYQSIVRIQVFRAYPFALDPHMYSTPTASMAAEKPRPALTHVMPSGLSIITCTEREKRREREKREREERERGREREEEREERERERERGREGGKRVSVRERKSEREEKIGMNNAAAECKREREREREGRTAGKGESASECETASSRYIIKKETIPRERRKKEKERKKEKANLHGAQRSDSVPRPKLAMSVISKRKHSPRRTENY